MIDLNNTWCKASEKIYLALVRNGFKSNDNIDLDIHTRFNLSDKKIFPVHKDNKYATHGMEIELKDNEFQYVESKPKNNFNDYGFEADFEGEILKEVKESKGIEYLGYFVGGNKTHYPCIWTKSGRIWKTSVSEKDRDLYNLKPIKKEWYENPDNFPCIVIYEEKEIKLMRSYSETSKHRKEPCLLTSEGGVYYSLDKCRPATKEEVLALCISQEPGDV